MKMFETMKNNRAAARIGLAAAAPSLFEPATLVAGKLPEFKHSTTPEQIKTFDLIVDRTRIIGDGIWFGVPFNLNREYESKRLFKRQNEISNPHLVLWGENDSIIPKRILLDMAKSLPNCAIETIPGIGHSMNLENPQLFVEYFIDFFS